MSPVVPQHRCKATTSIRASPGHAIRCAAALKEWAWSRTPWREIGYVRPKSWIGSLALGLAFGSAFKLLMKMIVMPLLGADPINQAYHFLPGKRAMIPGALFVMIFSGGSGARAVFPGYLF